MPHYYKQEVSHFIVEAKPVCFTRYLFSYVVGRRVRFKLIFTNQRDPAASTNFYLYESFNRDGKYVKYYTHIDKGTEVIFKGNRIDSEGNIKYSVALLYSSKEPSNAETIFSCKAINTRDRFVWAIINSIIVIILTLVITNNWDSIICDLKTAWEFLKNLISS